MSGQHRLLAQQFGHRRDLIGQLGQSGDIEVPGDLVELLDHASESVAAGCTELRRDGVFEDRCRWCHLIELVEKAVDRRRLLGGSETKSRTKSPARWTDSVPRRLPKLADELLTQQPDLLSALHLDALQLGVGVGAEAARRSSRRRAGPPRSPSPPRPWLLPAPWRVRCRRRRPSPRASAWSASWVRTVSCWFFIMVRTGGTTYFQSRKTMTANPTSCPMNVDTGVTAPVPLSPAPCEWSPRPRAPGSRGSTPGSPPTSEGPPSPHATAPSARSWPAGALSMTSALARARASSTILRPSARASSRTFVASRRACGHHLQVIGIGGGS